MSERYILYGGFEGNENDICGSSKSLGEFLLIKLYEAGDSVLLVSVCTILIYVQDIF